MRGKKAWGLKTKIMVLTLVPVVGSFILISAVLFMALFSSLRGAAQAELSQISQKHAHSFEGKINHAMNYLTILASEIEAQVASDGADREALQKNVLKVFGDYGLIDGSSVYLEPNAFDGRDAAYAGSAYGTGKSGRICWYFYMDDGKPAYIPEAFADDAEFDMPHYTDAKSANKPIYTDPVVHEINGKPIPMFTLTQPIRNTSGAFIGAVTVDLFLDDIYAQLQDESIFETGYMIIANGNQRIIYSPRYEDIGKTRNETGLGFSDPPSVENEDSFFFNAKSMLNDKASLVMVDSVYIPQLDSRFYVSVTAPLDEISADATQLTILIACFILIVIMAIAVLIYWLIRRISAPLLEIAQGVDKIAGGEYSARIEGDYTGDFALVKDSVNTMADRIEAYIKDSEGTLNILKSILNGMDAYLYVSDPETDEILFINDNMKSHFGLKGDGVGDVCWKVLQSDFDARCEFCPCYELDLHPKDPVVWEEHNTVTGRYYRNTDRYIDWIGGRKVHLQHSVDITDIKMAQFALDRRLKQQALMTAISQSFLSSTDIDVLVTNALHMVGNFMHVSQVLFYVLEDDGSTLTCHNEWINASLEMETRLGSKLVLEGPMLALLSNVSPGQNFCVTSNDARMKAAMASYRQSFQNYITAPIFLGDKVCAMLDFSREDGGKDWSESDINLAVLLSSLLSGVFEKNSMEGQLRRLSSIVESSPQLILYMTAEGHVDYVNPAAVTITGYTEDELLQGGLDILLDAQIVRDVKQKYIPATLENGTDNFEIDLICKNGQKRIMAFSSFTTGPDSANVGGIASDVTEIRRLEAELIAAKELAEMGSRSKSEFLSRMSHEMRTPMNAVIGMTNIARSSGDPEKKEYCLERIDNASRHLLGVINDILDMSKIEANKFELSYSEFNFERMLQRVLDVINFKIEEKGQTFSLYIDPAIPASLIGDEQRLVQVITNLLSNAVKFTPELGTIQLNVHVIDGENGDVTLRIEVVDSGIGISAEQQAKLFRSFEQADGSIARKFGGTGLGLAISKRIVELMGGEIWIESELDKGSRFIFTLKAEKGKASAADSLKKRININDLHIMAVDDSLDVCDYFRHVMNEIGAPCVTATSGAEALALFRNAEKPFDIMFIDWNMPVMNGIGLTRELRKITDANPIIIMISVAEWSDIEQEATQAGVNGFVPKPLFPSLLVDCITQHKGLVIAEEPGKIDAPSQRSYEGKTALLAEDVDINREIILTVLDDTKLRIECAENGRKAVEMFEANPEKYDIIFMDIHMPEVDGLEATRRIRALDMPAGAAVPIVAMTANVFREDVDRCIAAGMNDHIGKPIDFDELFEKLAKYLR